MSGGKMSRYQIFFTGVGRDQLLVLSLTIENMRLNMITRPHLFKGLRDLICLSSS